MAGAHKEPVAVDCSRRVNANADAFTSSNVAVTELLDEALARVARLEAVLAITGGTVHDVNNLLTVLSGNLYLLTESVRGHRKLYDKARSARNAAERGSTLMRELLTFARDPDNESQTICPANHAIALEPLLRRGFASEYSFEVHHSDDPWSVAASAAQFESAVTNLVINARDALSAPGSVEVHIDNVEVSSKQAVNLRVTSGDYVCVRVLDDGVGIPAAILPRVVEPLFTSKAAGHGNGLGLNMVQRFAQHCHGALAIDSVEAEGTEVRLWLPRSAAQAEVTANMTLPLSTLAGGNETVLLVFKDGDVREAIQDILEALGYTVQLAAMGKALVENRQAGLAPSVLVCDRTSANRRAERRWIDSLRRRKSNIRHIAILAPDVNAADIAPDAEAYLYRPIAVFDLARAVRAVLEK